MKMKWLVGMMAAFLFVFGGLAYLVNARGEAAMVLAGTKAARYPTIVVDAGHGGIDGGAVAADGTPEKDMNLAIATKLNALLQMAGFQTVMTRTEDISIHDASAKTTRAQKVSDIHNRMKLLDDTQNAILVSIHQNFYADKRSSGTQVFYSKNTKESQALANVLQKRIVSDLQPGNTRAIKPSGTSIYLLYYAKKPAVLVECGFVSNPEEAKRLKQDSYQDQMAFSIFSGIVEYLTAQPGMLEATSA